MKKLFPLLLVPVALIGIAATYTITQLTANLNPGNSTLIEVYDPAATPKSGKVLLTNYVKQAQIDTSAEIQAILGSVYQSTNSVTTRLAGIGAGTSGDVLFRDAAGWTNLAKGADNKILKLVGGFPTWQDDQTGGGGGLIGTVLNSVPITNTIFGVDNTGTNALAATKAMITNAMGIFNGSTTTFLAGDGTLRTPSGVETANTVHAPDGATTANTMAVFKDTSGTNVTAAASGASMTGTLTVNGDVNITGNMTNATTQTDTLYLSSLTETNKLLGLGATTNAIVATAGMVTNTLGRAISGSGALATVAGDIGAATATTPGANDDDTSVATSAFVTSSTTTFTGKTFDAAGTGNVLKQTKYLYLMRPDWGDGTGAVPQTNTFTTSGLMHYTFSGNAETNANYAIYEAVVPPDIDTSVAMTAVFGFKSGGTDTDTVTWHIAYGLGAAGTAYPVTLGTVATSPLAFSAVTPTTPAAGDYQVTSELTLTDWAASMTPGTPLLISIRRLQDSNDDGQTDVFLRIKYGSTQ